MSQVTNNELGNIPRLTQHHSIKRWLQQSSWDSYESKFYDKEFNKNYALRKF